MYRVLLDQDIKPLSEFRANAATFIRQVQTTKRPLVIITRGKSAAVLLDVVESVPLMEKCEAMKYIQMSARKIEKGKALKHKEAKRPAKGKGQR